MVETQAFSEPANKTRVADELGELAAAVTTFINNQYPKAQLEKPGVTRHTLGALPEYEINFPSAGGNGSNEYSLHAANLMQSVLEALHQEPLKTEQDAPRAEPLKIVTRVAHNSTTEQVGTGTPLMVNLPFADENILAILPKEFAAQIANFVPDESVFSAKTAMDMAAGAINRTHMIEKADVEYHMFNNDGDFKIEPVLQLHGFNGEIKKEARHAVPKPSLSFTERMAPTSSPYTAPHPHPKEVMTIRGEQGARLMATHIVQLKQQHDQVHAH